MSVSAIRQVMFAFLFLLFGMAVGTANGQDVRRRTEAIEGTEPGQTVWFHHIQTPLGVSMTDGQALCRAAYDALRGTKTTVPSVGELRGAHDPRAFFLSWSDGREQAETVFGIGENVVVAYRNALRKAAAEVGRGAPPKWVKLDIVQRGEAVSDFVARGSQLPLPDLLGVTFGPNSGFAFLPEQLISWDMVDPRRRLTVHYISKRLMEREEWDRAGKWLAISSYQGGHRICLIETQSFFCGGGEVVPLFRGHMLYDNPSADDLVGAAEAAADRLVEYCQRDGSFDCPLPEWEAGKEEECSPCDQAYAVIALCRMAAVTGEVAYRKAAIRAAARLAGFVRPYGSAPRAGCIPQSEQVGDAGGVVAAKQVTMLSTNALAVVALCEVLELTSDDDYEVPLAMLARHLLAQIQPGGDMVALRDYPSLRLRPRVETDPVCVALLALTKLYGATARPVFLESAETVAQRLRSQALDPRPMDALPRNVWLAEALDSLFTYTRNRDLADPAQRLAFAALLEQTRETDFPDLYGSVGDRLSATVAADRSRTVAVTARLLDDLKQVDLAKNLLGEALPYVLFQLQAQIQPPSAMYLKDPAGTIGLFRDHVRDYGFELRGQASQILSLLALTQALEALQTPVFPEDLAVQKSLPAARELLTTFPRYLSPRLASTASGPAGSNPVQFRNPQTETFTIMPSEGEKREKSDSLKQVPVRRIKP